MNLFRRLSNPIETSSLVWTEYQPDYWKSDVVDHGLRDGKGRSIGGFAKISPRWTGAEERLPGFVLGIYATRDGKKFGAIPPYTIVPSVEAGQVLAEKKLVEQHRRFEKAVTKGAGRQFGGK